MPIYMAPSRRYSSYRGEMSPAPGNLVGRRFHAQAPNRLWVTDISQFNVDGRKCWLSVIVDCFDGMVVDWKLGDRPDQELANSNLRDAAATLCLCSIRDCGFSHVKVSGLVMGACRPLLQGLV